MSYRIEARRTGISRRHRWPVCPETGKNRLRERKDVKLALKAIRRGRDAANLAGELSNRRECRGYQCPHCDGWHLTSKPQRAA